MMRMRVAGAGTVLNDRTAGSIVDLFSRLI